MLVSQRGRTSRLFSVALGLAGAAALAGGCAAPSDPTGEGVEALAAWPAHLAQAQTYVDQINDGDQLDNHYGSPASIRYDASGALHATTVCSTFITLLLESSYPGVVTSQVIAGLTGSSNPDSAHWYGGIDPAGTLGPVEGISLLPMDAAAPQPTGRTMSYLQVGDLLASMYSGTGHVMTVAAITEPSGPLPLSGTHALPDVAQVMQWRVHVYDSTSTIHGAVPGSTDSRYQDDPSQSDGNNHGIGSGDLYLYEDASADSPTQGQLAGWTWSTISATTYQVTAPDVAGYRPMVIGRMSGGGL